MKPDFSANIKNINFVLLLLIFLAGFLLTLALLYKVPTYGDESNFYNNVFQMMKGEPLQNYFHVALTEWLLFFYLLFVSFFTADGLDFTLTPTPQTYLYGKFLGLFLYLLAFALGVFVLQNGERKVKIRTLVFSILFFGSVGFVERFIRINSDSVSFVIYLIYLIVSVRSFGGNSSIARAFFINGIFVFLGLFSNVKSLYLILPLVALNTFSTFKNKWPSTQELHQKVNILFLLFLYSFGILALSVALWLAFVPKPFILKQFLEDTFNNITYTTRIDTHYPIQSYNSWRFYIFDPLVEYVGLPAFISVVGIFLFFLSRKFPFKKAMRPRHSWPALSQKFKAIFTTKLLYESFYPFLFLSLISYYFGIALLTVHWSRWGLPLGFMTVLFLSVAVEKLISPFSRRVGVFILFILLIPFLSLRFLLTADLIKMNYDPKEPEKPTRQDTEKFFSSVGIKLVDQRSKAAWANAPYTKNLDYVYLGELGDKKYADLEYLFYSPWGLGTLLQRENVDLSVHNQKAIIKALSDNISFRFPTLLSRHTFFSRHILWNVLGTTGVPEMDIMIEPAYGVIKLKKPLVNNEFSYSLKFSELSHYASPNSSFLNYKNFPKADFLFPPCYRYGETKEFSTGNVVPPPASLGGSGGQTAGLYCHSARFRLLYKGKYRVVFRGISSQEAKTARVYSSQPFSWDAKTTTMEFESPLTEASAEVGIATWSKKLGELTLDINYSF